MKKAMLLPVLLALPCFAWAQLSLLSDEFDNAASISNWNIHSTGPHSANYYETLELDGTLIQGAAVGGPAGNLTLIPGPGHSGWYANFMGPFLWKSITGNFVVSTRVTNQNKNNPGTPPTSDYNSAGLLARNPNTPGNENFIMANVGMQSYANGIGTETKTTVNGSSTLFLNPDLVSGEIRICRVGDTFRTYKKTGTDTEWILLDEVPRPDMPSTLQVGLIVNGWYMPQSGDPDIPPNLRAEFDYVRYADVNDECGCLQEMNRRMLYANVLLEGAYAGGGIMHTQLNDNNLLPNGQPFSAMPWQYGGCEYVGTFSPDVVDWVLVELRSAANINQIVFQKAALLLANGSLADAAWSGQVAGVELDRSLPNGSYYVVVRHRNHVDVIAVAATSLPNTVPIDFSNPANVSGGADQLKDMGGGDYAFLAGDFDGNGVVTVADYNLFTTQMSFMNNYHSGDCDLDGNVLVSDYNLYLGNAGTIGVQEIRY